MHFKAFGRALSVQRGSIFISPEPESFFEHVYQLGEHLFHIRGWEEILTPANWANVAQTLRRPRRHQFSREIRSWSLPDLGALTGLRPPVGASSFLHPSLHQLQGPLGTPGRHPFSCQPPPMLALSGYATPSRASTMKSSNASSDHSWRSTPLQFPMPVSTSLPSIGRPSTSSSSGASSASDRTCIQCHQLRKRTSQRRRNVARDAANARLIAELRQEFLSELRDNGAHPQEINQNEQL